MSLYGNNEAILLVRHVMTSVESKMHHDLENYLAAHFWKKIAHHFSSTNSNPDYTYMLSQNYFFLLTMGESCVAVILQVNKFVNSIKKIFLFFRFSYEFIYYIVWFVFYLSTNKSWKF
jgi:hypothetical protein